MKWYKKVLSVANMCRIKMYQDGTSYNTYGFLNIVVLLEVAMCVCSMQM